MAIEQDIEPQILAIHSQSNRPDAPLDFTDPAEQAFDSRALTLPHVDILATSSPIEQAYLDYLHYFFKISIPEIITPPQLAPSLSESIVRNQSAIEEIRRKQQESGRPFILSVFDPTSNERELLTTLKRAGVDVIPEVNFDVAQRLGNKSGFREFCDKYGIPQVSGGVFKDTENLRAFIARSQRRHQGIIIKHPFGTAGEGIEILRAGDIPSQEQLDKWKGWMEGAGSVVAEEFHPKGGEHALHIYIDPVTKKTKITGVYDQLTSTTSEGTQAHYGASSPIKDKGVKRQLIHLANRTIIPALLKEGYTGPACFDILSHPLHFMELNTRAGANYYAHREVEQVAQNLYGKKPGEETPFVFLAGIPTEETSFLDFFRNHQEALTPRANGTLIFTNPSRHKFGKFDIIAYSPYGADEAERILHEGITQIWGHQKAEEIFGKIYKRQ